MTSKFHKSLALILVLVLALTLTAGIAVCAEPDLKPNIEGTYTGNYTEIWHTNGTPSGYSDTWDNEKWVVSDVDYSANTLVITQTSMTAAGLTTLTPKSYSFTVNPNGSVSVKLTTYFNHGGKWETDYLFADNKMTGTDTNFNENNTIRTLSQYSLTKESTDYTVSVFAGPARGGTVSGGGTFSRSSNDIITVKARANSGWEFQGWYYAGKLMSTNESYTFSTDSDMRLDAVFAEEKKVISGPRNADVKFSELYGEVLVGRDDGTGNIEWELAELGTVLEVNDIIKCEIESGCVLSMSDMTTFRIKEDTEIKMTSPEGKDSKIDLIMGNIWVNVTKMIKKGSIAVEMNQAVAGIKGTTFACEETGNTSTLLVFEGEVSYTSKATGEVVMVKAGEKCVADASGRMDKSDFDIELEAEAWGIPAEYLYPKSSSHTWIWILAALFVIAVIVVAAGAVILVAVKRKGM